MGKKEKINLESFFSHFMQSQTLVLRKRGEKARERESVCVCERVFVSERERESASVCFARLRFLLLLLPTPDVCFHSRSGFHRRRRSCCCCCFHAGSSTRKQEMKGMRFFCLYLITRLGCFIWLQLNKSVAHRTADLRAINQLILLFALFLDLL